MIGPRKGFGAARNVSREAILHGKEVRSDVSVVVDEILYSEFNSVFGSENNSKPLWHLVTGRCRKHLGITAKLNRVVWLWRAGKFRIPDLISSRLIENEEVGEASELQIFQFRDRKSTRLNS